MGSRQAAATTQATVKYGAIRTKQWTTPVQQARSDEEWT